MAEPDLSWRSTMLAEIRSGDTSRATDALLSLAYYESDRLWIEGLLLELIGDHEDWQVRALAVICVGHVARLHRSISVERMVPRLRELLEDERLGSRASNALADIEMFVEPDGEVELLDRDANWAVLRLPGREVPGVFLQGDTMFTVYQSLVDGEVEDAQEHLAKLLGYYESVLRAKGIKRPY